MYGGGRRNVPLPFYNVALSCRTTTQINPSRNAVKSTLHATQNCSRTLSSLGFPEYIEGASQTHSWSPLLLSCLSVTYTPQLFPRLLLPTPFTSPAPGLVEVIDCGFQMCYAGLNSVLNSRDFTHTNTHTRFGSLKSEKMGQHWAFILSWLQSTGAGPWVPMRCTCSLHLAAVPTYTCYYSQPTLLITAGIRL